MKILAINPGSTSTKIAVFENEKEIFVKSIKHSVEELADFAKITDQFEYRKNVILKTLEENNIELKSIACFIGRGGLLNPVSSGVFLVNEKMVEDLRDAKKDHASNLGGLIAKNLADKIGVKAFIADPVVVDEMSEIAKISGHPLFRRKSVFHALNQKAVARRYAKEIGKNYEDLNLIVVHLGGGVSIGAHEKGRVIDVNQALDGDGPFSPERSGSLPIGDLVKVCYSGKYSESEIMQMVKGKGGLVAYLGTNNAEEAAKRAIAGDKEAALIMNAMIYQISKEIGAMSVVLKGKVDAIILTGGIAYNKEFNDGIIGYVQNISQVVIYAGEDEMGSLALNALRALNGEAKILEYA